LTPPLEAPKQAREVPAPIPKAQPENGALALGTPQPSPSGQAPAARVKVGLLLPLSGAGQTAIIAQSLQRAAELAISDMQAGQVIELVVRDDGGTPEGALKATTEMVDAGAEIILGPLFSRSVATASSVTRSRQVPMIAFSNDRTVAGTGVHLLSFFAGPEVQRVTDYAVSKGKRRFAAFIPDDTYGKTVEQRFRESVARNSGTIVAAKTYPADGSGRTVPILEALKALKLEMAAAEQHGDPIDALLLPGGEEMVPIVGPMLAQVGIDTSRIKILGTGALDSPTVGREPAFVGAWFASPEPKGFQSFAERFSRVHGLSPPRIATLAYDATAVAVALAGNPAGARYIPSALTRMAGYNGVDGLFRLTAEGPAERALAILEVRATGAEVVEPAAGGFF
ncbi:MAG TPA: penicillin-binding protein activator, partial [Hyphomicrobiaceae bacterium]|nr:penicillin-binding protein activator [Hyphomicrobiaceae bacterium]